MLLYKRKEKCGCEITMDAAVEEEDNPPTFEIVIHRLWVDDNECKKHPEEYYDDEYNGIYLETNVKEIKQIAAHLNKFASDFEDKKVKENKIEKRYDEILKQTNEAKKQKFNSELIYSKQVKSLIYAIAKREIEREELQDERN